MQTGQLVLPVKYSLIEFACGNNKTVIDDIIYVTIIDKSGKRLKGLYNYNGSVILDCDEQSITPFRDGKAMVWKEKGERFDIDTKGTRVG